MPKEIIPSREIDQFIGEVRTSIRNIQGSISRIEQTQSLTFDKIDKNMELMNNYLTACSKEHRSTEVDLNGKVNRAHDKIQELESFNSYVKAGVAGAWALLLIVFAEIVSRVLGR